MPINKSEMLSRADPSASAYHRANSLPPVQSSLRAMLRDNIKPIGYALLTTLCLTAAISAALPVINRFWLGGIRLLVEWLQLNFAVSSATGFFPVLIAPHTPLTGADFAWHIGGALACIAGARLVLKPPFRALLASIASLYLICCLLVAASPAAFPYSISEHTRWLSVFTVGLIVLLPMIMALTHAIIERSHDRRVLGILLIWAFFILTLPLKLVSHALLIQSFSKLAMPILFLVFGPAMDVVLLTTLYTFIVTWRHNSTPD